MKIIVSLISILLIFSSIAMAQDCDPPGEFVGLTGYPVQSSGVSANRIAFDQMYGIHITWMVGSSIFDRNVYYNFRNESGEWLAEGGLLVNSVGGAGYPTLALNADNAAAITYHNTSNNYVNLAVDLFRGMGVFSYSDPPDLAPSGNHTFWPQVAVAANGDIHIITVEHTQEQGVYPSLLYTRSTDNGQTWSNSIVVDSVALLNGAITASADGKVGIVYLKPIMGGEFSQVKNDVCYFVSDDGRSWDFRHPINITDYANDGDELYCPWGIDCVFDRDGNLNATWVTGHIDDDGYFIDEVTGLWHFSEREGYITEIAESSDTLLTCLYGAVTLPISQPSIAYGDYGYTDALGVTYIGYDETDASDAGDCLGDIYAVFGLEGGSYWTSPVNLTQTHTPGCLPGECQSENFVSSAEMMMDYDHVTYVMQRLGDESDTAYYMPISVPVGDYVNEDAERPKLFDLYGNYPNPFNGSTSFDFELRHAAKVELTVYDITGAKVETIYSGSLDSGKHSMRWDAGRDIASGQYFYKLSADGESRVEKMVYLK